MIFHYCVEKPVQFWFGKFWRGAFKKAHKIPKVQQSNVHYRTFEGPGAKFNYVKLLHAVNIVFPENEVELPLFHIESLQNSYFQRDAT